MSQKEKQVKALYTRGHFYFKAADVVKLSEKPYNGVKSLEKLGVRKRDVKLIPGRGYHFNKSGVKRFCTQHKLPDLTAIKPKPASCSKVHGVVKAMKTEMSKQVYNTPKVQSSALAKSKIMNSRAKDAARAKVREIVYHAAKTLAKQAGMTSPADSSFYYDLAYNFLYASYKAKTSVDIKQEADKLGITGLQHAVNKGIIKDLFTLAKQIFIISSK